LVRDMIKDVARLTGIFIAIFFLMVNSYAFGLNKNSIRYRSLGYIHPGDTLYLFEWDPLENSYVDSEKKKFKKVKVEEKGIAPDDQYSIKINDEVVSPSCVYINEGNIFVNLYFWTSGEIADDDLLVESPSQVVYFDETGRHHSADEVFFGTMNGKDIIISYVAINGKIFGCYRYIGSKNGSSIFSGKLFDNGEIKLKSIENNKRSPKKFSGIFRNGEIRGRWELAQGEIDLDAKVLPDPYSVQGYYTVPLDKKIPGEDHMSLTLHDDGTYSIYFEEIASKNSQLIAHGYSNDTNNILWQGAGDQCWQKIAFKNTKTAVVTINKCQVEGGIGSFCSGIYER
jgi:hypothetical protein